MWTNLPMWRERNVRNSAFEEDFAFIFLIWRKIIILVQFSVEYPSLEFPLIRAANARMLPDNPGFTEVLFENIELLKIFHKDHSKTFVLPPAGCLSINRHDHNPKTTIVCQNAGEKRAIIELVVGNRTICFQCSKNVFLIICCTTQTASVLVRRLYYPRQQTKTLAPKAGRTSEKKFQLRALTANTMVRTVNLVLPWIFIAFLKTFSNFSNVARNSFF